MSTYSDLQRRKRALVPPALFVHIDLHRLLVFERLWGKTCNAYVYTRLLTVCHIISTSFNKEYFPNSPDHVTGQFLFSLSYLNFDLLYSLNDFFPKL